jgi:hypothetical protein
LRSGAFGLQPHRQEKWKLSKDPEFAAKVRDVVGVYLDPPERAVVLAVWSRLGLTKTEFCGLRFCSMGRGWTVWGFGCR